MERESHWEGVIVAFTLFWLFGKALVYTLSFKNHHHSSAWWRFFILTIWEGEELFFFFFSFFSTHAHAHTHTYTLFLHSLGHWGSIREGRYGAWDMGMRLRCMAGGVKMILRDYWEKGGVLHSFFQWRAFGGFFLA